MSLALSILLTGGSPQEPLMVEDCFSAFTYSGNGSTQTITNGIDLAGKGGLVWVKRRGGAAVDHLLFDTVRSNASGDPFLSSSTTSAQVGATTDYLTYLSNGFTINNGANGLNVSGDSQVAWAFARAAKFFDCGTYTGNGTAGRQIPHALGTAPGMIVVKRYAGAGGASDWAVWHRSLAEDYHLLLNTTASQTLNSSYPLFGKPSEMTATYFTLGQSDATGANGTTNLSGDSFVWYAFAHDSSADGIIQCGSYTGNGSATGPEITLGWEPQFLLVRSATTAGGANWYMLDTARGLTTGGNDAFLYANLPNAEGSAEVAELTATGFRLKYAGGGINDNGESHVYLAIRRGPMRTPTSGTQVYNAVTRAGTNAAFTVSTAGFSPDLLIAGNRSGGGGPAVFDRIRGGDLTMFSSSTSQEGAGWGLTFDHMGGYKSPTANSNVNFNASGYNYIDWFFRRAPGFLDVVAYTGTGAARTVAHGLKAVPELMIVKMRGGAAGWRVYHASLGPTKNLRINATSAEETDSTFWNNTAPSASVFSLGTNGDVNQSTGTFVAYLFASVPGISCITSFVGDGTVGRVINCGFSAGARLVLVKRTDAAGDWLIADTARGIIAASEPTLKLNSTAAESSVDWLDPDPSGFIVNQEATFNANVNGATYIVLAVA